METIKKPNVEELLFEMYGRLEKYLLEIPKCDINKRGPDFDADRHIRVMVSQIKCRNKMKLQKHFAYKYKDKNHYKYIITIPNKIVEMIGWVEGEKLLGEGKGNTLLLKSIIKEEEEKNI